MQDKYNLITEKSQGQEKVKVREKIRLLYEMHVTVFYIAEYSSSIIKKKTQLVT